MSEHTPGTWSVEEEPDSYGFNLQVVGPDYVICRNIPSTKAENAHLIASAPRMYETGRALLDALGFPGGRWDMDWPETPQVVAFFDAVHRLHELEP